MAKVIVTARVKDLSTWEQGFRTHGDLFRGYGVSSPIYFGTNENGEVALLEEVADVAALTRSLQAADNQAAMESDGVIADSVKIFVLNSEFSF
jgi:hypothetical protein